MSNIKWRLRASWIVKALGTRWPGKLLLCSKFDIIWSCEERKNELEWGTGTVGGTLRYLVTSRPIPRCLATPRPTPRCLVTPRPTLCCPATPPRSQSPTLISSLSWKSKIESQQDLKIKLPTNKTQDNYSSLVYPTFLAAYLYLQFSTHLHRLFQTDLSVDF